MPKTPPRKVSKFFLVNPTSNHQHVTFLDCYGNYKSISISPVTHQYITTELQSDNKGCLAPAISSETDRVDLERLGDGGGLIVGEEDRMVWTYGSPDQALRYAIDRIAEKKASKDRELLEETKRSEERKRENDAAINAENERKQAQERAMEREALQRQVEKDRKRAAQREKKRQEQEQRDKEKAVILESGSSAIESILNLFLK